MIEDIVEFKENGVIYYFNKLNNTIVDINVEDSVTRLDLVPRTMDRKQYCNVYLDNISKTFPNVKTLVIGVKVRDIKISNMMFPNVKDVISYNLRYYSGKMLMKKKFNGQRELLNTFCKSEQEEICMHEISSIEDMAFEGCKSSKLTDCGQMSRISANAFTGYAAERSLSEANPVFAAGTLIIDVHESLESLDLPEYGKIVCKNKISYLKNATIDNLKDTAEFKDIVLGNLILDIDSDSFVDSNDVYDALRDIKTENIEIKQMKYYKSIDGVIYSANGDCLVYMPKLKTGDYHVVAGTKVISAMSFAETSLDSVVLPESVRIIKQSAFFNSNIKSITLNDGLCIIMPHVFNSCKNLEELVIPESVVSIGESSSINLKHVIVKGHPCSFLKALINDSDTIMLFEMNDDKMYIPGNMVQKCVVSLEAKLLNSEKITNTEILNAANNTETKHYLECMMYKLRMEDGEEDEELKKMLKRTAKNILLTFLNKNDMEMFRMSLNWGIASENTLKAILNITNESGNITAASYVMESINRKGQKSSFRL